MRRDDEGSTLVIGVIVMMLLSTLALAGLARTLSVMTLVGHGQRYDSALALADAGLNDAIYRLREGIAPTAADWTFPATAGTWHTVTPGKTFRYRVVQTGPTEYQVDSVGKQGEIAHGIRAVVRRGPGFALFADDRLDIGGTGPGRLGLSLSAVLELGGPSTEPVHIGSNSAIHLASGASAGDYQHVYANATCNVDLTGACPGEVPHPDGKYPLPKVEEPAGTTQADRDACTNMTGILLTPRSFAGVVNGRAGQPYVCVGGDVTFGTMSVVNGPLVVYVMNGALDLRGALVNAGGRAADVRIYKSGTGRVYLNGVSLPLGISAGDVTFTGMLYAPDSTIEINANQWWKGSIVAKRIEATNTPLVTITYDRGLDRLVKEWDVTRYSQIPSGEANI